MRASARTALARVRDIGVKSAMYTRTFIVALTLVGALGTAAVYWLGGRLVIEGAISLGTLGVSKRLERDDSASTPIIFNQEQHVALDSIRQTREVGKNVDDFALDFPHSRLQLLDRFPRPRNGPPRRSLSAPRHPNWRTPNNTSIASKTISVVRAVDT